MRLRGLVIGVLLVPGGAAAHTPGLSQGTYRVDGRRVAAELVLARGEAAELVPRIDRDRDGVLAEIELLQAQDALADALAAGALVQDGDVACPGVVERVTFVEEDGLAFAAAYTCPEGQPLDALTVRLPLVGRLASGHRHLGQVRFVGASAGPVDLPVDFVAQRRRPALTIRRPTVPPVTHPSPTAPSAGREGRADASGPEGRADASGPEGRADASGPEGRADASGPGRGGDASGPEDRGVRSAAPGEAPRWRVFAGLAALFGLAGLVVHRVRGRRRGA